MNADILIIINFDLNDKNKTIIRTNATPEALPEILSDWIRDQVGTGKDLSKHDEKDNYVIKINLDLSGDIFTTSSDTGNKGLTNGIVMTTFGMLEEIQILPLGTP